MGDQAEGGCIRFGGPIAPCQMDIFPWPPPFRAALGSNEMKYRKSNPPYHVSTVPTHPGCILDLPLLRAWLFIVKREIIIPPWSIIIIT